MSVIILDGQLKSALAGVRSLGSSGVEVIVGAQRSTALALHSRYARRGFVYTDPKLNRDVFIRELRTEAERIYSETGSRPVLFCFSDATYGACEYAREQLSEHVVFHAPAHASIEIATSKKATYALAEQLSIPTIPTHGDTRAEGITFPAVVKYVHSIVWQDSVAISGSAEFVFSQAELEETYATVAKKTGEAPLIMDFIKGDEYGVEMVCKDGEPVVLFTHKRIRSLSPRGGAGVVKEMAQDSPDTRLMEEYARALALRLQWQGPCMVEFKQEKDTGKLYLMEFNGRFWGSLPLPVSAGIDFPHIAYVCAQGEEPILHQKSVRAVRTRHFLGDCKWLYGVLFANDPLRAYVYPDRLTALFDFKKEFFLSQGDIWSWKDPVPALFEYVDILYKTLWK